MNDIIMVIMMIIFTMDFYISDLFIVSTATTHPIE